MTAPAGTFGRIETRPARCTRNRCPSRATYTVDDPRRPGYAGPALVCEDHLHAMVHDLQHGHGIHVSRIKDTP